MALTGLDIFKLLPKTNCKKCGMPTCLAFAMQLAQKRAELSSCPDVSEEAKQTLAAAAAPPVRQVKFGTGDSQVQMGQETVLFRHEEKFYDPTILAATASDQLQGDDLVQRIKAINVLQFDRVGTHVAVNALALVNDSGSPESFAATAAVAMENSNLALILISDSPPAMGAALGKCAGKVPLIASASASTVEAMAKLAKENKCPLVVKAESLDGLADLTEKAKGAGVEDIVLSLEGTPLKDQLYGGSAIRRLALKKSFRALGYPVFSLASGKTDDERISAGASLICKYSSVVVVDSVNPAVFLPLLTTVMNIYCDPQKPVQVESKLYAIGEPDETSPVLFTTNFSLTYYTVESDVEASRVPAHILVVDTEGTSVLTAYSGDKLNEKAVADTMNKLDIEKQVSHRKLIIPGYVAVMSGKLEEATGWDVMVGPRESSLLPKYLQEVWS
jgi:acetyl-CoA decarbonylase/synthase, CODH/ACS complex subunit gamma